MIVKFHIIKQDYLERLASYHCVGVTKILLLHKAQGNNIVFLRNMRWLYNTLPYLALTLALTLKRPYRGSL